MPFFACGNIKSIYNRSTTPYIFDFPYEWDFIFGHGQAGNERYDDCTLCIPFETKDAYENAMCWKDFKNIVEFEPASISSVISTGNNEVNAIYSLDGKRIAEKQRGLNIVRMKDGGIRKVFVK